MNLTPYDPQRGLRFDWDDGFEIALQVHDAEVHLTANRAGLLSLARHLMTLAQTDVPSGHHLHLTAHQELDSTLDLILERRDD